MFKVSKFDKSNGKSVLDQNSQRTKKLLVVYQLSFFVKKLCHCLANHWLKLWTPFQGSQKSIKNIILSFLFLEMKRFDRSNI